MARMLIHACIAGMQSCDQSKGVTLSEVGAESLTDVTNRIKHVCHMLRLENSSLTTPIK